MENTVPYAALGSRSLLGTGLVRGVSGRFGESPELRTSLPMRCHGLSGPGGRHTYLGAPAAPSPGPTGVAGLTALTAGFTVAFMTVRALTLGLRIRTERWVVLGV